MAGAPLFFIFGASLVVMGLQNADAQFPDIRNKMADYFLDLESNSPDVKYWDFPPGTQGLPFEQLDALRKSMSGLKTCSCEGPECSCCIPSKLGQIIPSLRNSSSCILVRTNADSTLTVEVTLQNRTIIDRTVDLNELTRQRCIDALYTFRVCSQVNLSFDENDPSIIRKACHVVSGQRKTANEPLVELNLGCVNRNEQDQLSFEPPRISFPGSGDSGITPSNLLNVLGRGMSPNLRLLRSRREALGQFEFPSAENRRAPPALCNNPPDYDFESYNPVD